MITKEKGAITFGYKIDDLFNDVGLISSYMTKDIKNEEGSMMDEFAITDDERELFDVCMKQAAPNIFEAMLKMSTCTDGYGIENGEIRFSVKDFNAYNENVLPLVDSTIYDCLKFGVLTEFYSMNIHPDLRKISNDKYSDVLLLLNQRLFQLKRRSVSSLY
jgi:hypothetical protein